MMIMRMRIKEKYLTLELSSDVIDQMQVSYRSKGLTADDVQSIITFFTTAVELDLSDNKIEYLPRGLPINILAINLSKNKFHSLIGFDQVRFLRMLKLYGNNIERYDSLLIFFDYLLQDMGLANLHSIRILGPLR
jgi:hypothetical protein